MPTAGMRPKTANQRRAAQCVFYGAALLLNLLGVSIAALFHIPLHLNTAGTVLAAASGGCLPGIAVGFLTSIIHGLIRSQEMYYSILNVLTAICTAFAVKHRVFRSKAKPFVLIPVLGVLTGVLGSVLTWFLNGSNIGGQGAQLALRLSENGAMGRFPALLLSDLLLELLDKAITVTAGVLIFRKIPKMFRKKLRSGGVWQARLSEQMAAAVRQSKCRSVSLRTKLIVIMTASAVLIAAASAAISLMLFRQSTIDDHIEIANGVTSLTADALDPAQITNYLTLGEAAPGYAETEQKLSLLMQSTPDVQYLYVYQIREDGCHVVFDIDTAETAASEPGDVIEFDPSFYDLVPALLAGREIDPIISDDSYGWLLTVYRPVYAADGTCVCYAAADVSMNLLSDDVVSFLAKLISMLLGFFIFILAVTMWLVEHNLILPVNTMSYAAGAFAYNSDEALEENVARIRGLRIHTGDEIETLYRAFVKTTADSVRYVTDIQHKTETISKMQNGLIMVLADMVESRDKCTGDHVRKTAAYVGIILEEMRKRGMYPEQITDEFIENVKNAAPLHDIGKIHVSDIILNKPDRLTDEEFVRMKQHTTLGSAIIDRAIAMVPDSVYLDEAKNLSEYHHEKWNGTGYPHGISGEEIPLSARIMAVADVFDALVSRRSYKEPFSFEKAMDIIREGAGTHFDPQVAEAFIGASDRVRRVAEEFSKETDR